MKKKFFVAVILSVVIFASSASPAAIDFRELSKEEKFTQLFGDFLKVYPELKLPNMAKKNSLAKEIETSKKLYDFLENKKETSYSEDLLKLLVMRCLYNFDAVNSDSVLKAFSSIDHNYGERAEHHWIYGNFLVTSSKNVNGKKELEKYMEMKDFMLNKFFIEDYAYAQLMCSTPINALYTITNGGNIPEEMVENKPLLSAIKSNILESSSSSSYETNQLWKISQEQEGYRYIYSTMLGISVPCKDKWNLRVSPFTPGKPAFCIVGPNDFTLQGSKLSINVMILAYPDSIYTEGVKQNYLRMAPKISESKKSIKGKEFEYYVFEDKSKYNDLRNGAKSYLYYSKIEPTQFSGARCEHDLDFEDMKSDGTGPKFLSIKPSFKRLSEPIHVIIFVDSCNAISKEAEAFLDDFFERSIFE